MSQEISNNIFLIHLHLYSIEDKLLCIYTSIHFLCVFMFNFEIFLAEYCVDRECYLIRKEYKLSNILYFRVSHIFDAIPISTYWST